MLTAQTDHTGSASTGQGARRYRYAMISSEIRRDLQRPLGYFQRLDIYHFYRSAPWNDMKTTEFDARTIRFRLPLDLFRKLWRVRPEIIQGPEPLSLLMLPFLAATLVYLWLNPQVRLVTLSLEPIPLEKKYHPLIASLFRLILRAWFRRAAVIFWFDHGSHRNLLANGAPPEKLANVIYGSWGINRDEFSPEGRAVVAAPTSDPVILYVGRLSPVKGVSYLLDAYRLLLDWGTAAQLAIVGDGPERPRLEEQARQLGLEGRITWHGSVKNADLPPYMRAGALLVLPSVTTKLWVQQLSITAWQAMGCGLPVVATDTGCMAEFTPPEVGILVPERNAAALADAIATLLSDPDRRARMATAARAYAIARFDDRRNVAAAEHAILEWCQCV
ncbi:MAG: glycosyltransferase family 4 protein [Oscillochloris sp.]|nr:glycosyltransferase family 4 protein [Oscillochloris sp.]